MKQRRSDECILINFHYKCNCSLTRKSRLFDVVRKWRHSNYANLCSRPEASYVTRIEFFDGCRWEISAILSRDGYSLVDVGEIGREAEHGGDGRGQRSLLNAIVIG